MPIKTYYGYYKIESFNFFRGLPKLPFPFSSYFKITCTLPYMQYIWGNIVIMLWIKLRIFMGLHVFSHSDYKKVIFRMLPVCASVGVYMGLCLTRVWTVGQILFIFSIEVGVRGSVVVEALSYKPEGHGIASRWGGFFLIYLILPAALWPWGRLSL
jgi:hypothetical protein